jgi:hypothetical protein
MLLQCMQNSERMSERISVGKSESQSDCRERLTLVIVPSIAFRTRDFARSRPDDTPILVLVEVRICVVKRGIEECLLLVIRDSKCHDEGLKIGAGDTAAPR